ncbi:hypothetical protein DICPUDRAFT_90584 [Dictyostelium purpureum]|uniref:Profilin n=1 Tax=Dictyostelium purpureum TaxID=5786 RepID=F1A3K2_DICPU|nr:uncharacterized protein DICPUDRAFT_90584 [Dictyostelium purpureum]EGC29227.1 hypothetical protein DICPUDRAFT_90584 [Dictyostelium purpureum]|eukprot:XP_003294249.1 hypothetical protein DICPUDRAFT_90584 [Dictyostelium purpureum]
MTWQAYVDSNLIGAGFINAQILSAADGSNWATSKGFTVSATEAAHIIACFKDSSKASSMGITINGVKNFVLKADDKSIYAKKDTGGIVIVKTNQCILFGQYDSALQPGSAAKAVESLGDYLRDSGF